MHYNSVAQTEQDPLTTGTHLPATAAHHRDPLTEAPISSPVHTHSAFNQWEDTGNGESTASRVSSMLRSLASSHSYEVVQGNELEEAPVEPLKIRKRDTGIGPSNMHESRLNEPPVRTASISRHLPLNQPRPDLQSMQGAYVKNVERLEETAERLSMTSSVEEGVQYMKSDQRSLHRQSSAPTRTSLQINTRPSRQVSSASLSNSIASVNAAARWGGYSPSGYVTSFQESFRSGFWSQDNQGRPVSQGSRIEARLPDLDLPGSSFDPMLFSPSNVVPSQLPQSWTYQTGAAAPVVNHGHLQRQPSNASADRPETSSSSDTHRQAGSLFRDFDGVHFANSLGPMNRQASLGRQVPLNRPPLAKDSKAFREAQPGQDMVYYPAPVPMMLNLPPKLSNSSAADRDKRRRQALSGIPAELRKSAAWLQGDLDGVDDRRKSKQTLAGLPPQLRASAFFDQPSVTQNLKLQGGSAVATLDSILDASAHAPVSAFTDHPIVGKLGREVYGKEVNRKSVQIQDATSKHTDRRVSSLSNMLGAGRRVSSALSMDNAGRHVSQESRASRLEADVHGDRYEEESERMDENSIAPNDDELADEEGELPEDENQSEGSFTGAPTTLLAELQMRKAQQKNRNRTAADAFPNGMHSTLLELDAVTQLQQKARKQKHITLAWEDHDVADGENFDDDDVPLGVLFPGQKSQINTNRPVGLLEKRHIEDNEPLSQRRARLRGEAPSLHAGSIISGAHSRTGPVMSTIEQSGISGNTIPEEEAETLAQRLKRLRAEREKGLTGETTDEGAGQVDATAGDESAAPISNTPDPEETLGQRKKRLQAEAANAQHLKPKHSMASLLSGYPINGVRIPSNESTGVNAKNTPQTGQQTNLPNGLALPSMIPSSAIHSQPVRPIYSGSQPPLTSGGFMYNNAPVYSPNMAVQMQMAGYGYPFAMQQQIPVLPLGMGPPLDPKQRDGIERWRQSVA